VKIIQVETLISAGEFSNSNLWKSIRDRLHEAIQAVDWPPGSGKFTIYPESGKKRGEGNGVGPIKLGLIKQLVSEGWIAEHPLDIATVSKPGDLDAVLITEEGPIIAMEWETGNISSSHRALNKMALGLLKEVITAGVLVVPSRLLYPYLTDRIGNFAELVPYLDLWKSIPCKTGVLEIVVIEHDATSIQVPRIPKGTSGRALA
jgi:hypothetical protein